MAGADVIEAAIGITLLLIVTYVVLGSITTAAVTVSSARKDITLQNEARLDTAIHISNARFTVVSDPNHKFTFDLQNTGSEPIQDFNRTDVFLSISGEIPVRYSFAADKVGIGGDVNDKTWSYMTISPITINPSVLDPGETMTVQINNFLIYVYPHPPASVTVIAPNGVSAVSYGQ